MVNPKILDLEPTNLSEEELMKIEQEFMRSQRKAAVTNLLEFSIVLAVVAGALYGLFLFLEA